jgi:DeoR family transcriptional regulator, aga operon transcriptional repressor
MLVDRQGRYPIQTGCRVEFVPARSLFPEELIVSRLAFTKYHLPCQWTNESKHYKKKQKGKGSGEQRFRGPTVLNEERRRAILDVLNREGRALVTDLACQFETSYVTIRKDLEILHAQGLVHRTHGGVLLSREGALADPTLREKEKLHRREKLRIAEAAAAMVQEGQVVILDSGTTTTAIARALRGFHNLTIVTNAVNIAPQLAGTDVEVILTGGTLRKNSFSLVGPIAEDTLRRLNADVLFLGVDGFDVHYGLSTPNLLEAKVNRMMVEISKKVVAVCDASKFGRRSLSLIVPPMGMHHVITDHGAPKSDLKVLKEAGIEVTLV